MSGPRVLVVAYTFPPMPTIGANRWDSMARHLRRLGSEVFVVTTSAFGHMHNSDEERFVRRASDLTSAPWLRRLFGRGPIPPPSDAPATEAHPAAVDSPLPEVLRQIFVPDLYVISWLPQALRVARQAVAELEIDCVVTTSPYESVHLLGRSLRRRGPSWIADFRDGWLFEPYRPPFRTSVQRALDERLERQVVCGADRVVTATAPIAADFNRRLSVQAIHISSGFDPLKHRELPRVQLPVAKQGVVTLVHTGKLSGVLSGVNNRNPRGLFAAMRALRDERFRLRLVLAGRLDTDDLQLVRDSGLEGQVVLLGQLSHAESIALQRQADALVLIASAGSELTGKLVEYLMAGKPILALAGAEVEQVISSTGTGVTVPPDDIQAITTQLRRLLSGDFFRTYDPQNLEDFVYPRPAERMAEVIDAAITNRTRSLSRTR
jgi:glycosyltransferase involved in cell wall biosynthesis